MRGPFLSLLVLTAAILAGCVGADSSSPESAGAGPAMANAPGQFDDTTGAIEGVVTDVEVRPIPNALVGIIMDDPSAPPVSATTDDRGFFSLSRLQPGDYNLAASGLGFDSASKRVSVVAGALTSVSFMLEALPTDAPYGETLIKRGVQTGAMFRLSPQCLYLTQTVPVENAATNLIKTCNGARVCDDGDCEFAFTDQTQKEMDWRSIVAEMEWQAQSGATGRAYWMDVIGPNVSRMAQTGSIDQADKRYWMVHKGESPIQIRLDLPTSLVEREIEEADWYSYPDGEGCAQSSCYWFYRTWPSYCDLSSATGQCGSTPVDYGIQREATFTVYLSLFYKETAPEAFTAVPDA